MLYNLPIYQKRQNKPLFVFMFVLILGLRKVNVLPYESHKNFVRILFENVMWLIPSCLTMVMF